MSDLHPQRVTVGLDYVDGGAFEDFAQDFYAAITGKDFVPIGGMHDGGADGFIELRTVLEDRARTDFLQASVEENHRGKIRRTVARLREFGREPRSITYVTSRPVQNPDRDEMQLGDELDLAVRIRERRYIASHINTNPGTKTAFRNHIEPHLAFLRSVGSAPVLTPSRHVQAPDVYVFLRQEVERQQGHTSLLNAVLDALIQWALEGTDPDEEEFRDRDEIITRILKAVPAAEQFLEPERVNDRLQVMASKNYPGGRAVRWHQKENLYCLPYETRQRIEEENQEDTALRIEVRDHLRSRIAEEYEDELTDEQLTLAADVGMQAIGRSFEREGLSFSHFLERTPDAADRITIEDSIREVLHERGVGGSLASTIAEGLLQALRGAFYSSTETERMFLSKLSRTYALLFTLNTEPRLVEYFNEMTADFYLYVGTDILVRALSERYLSPEDRMTRNMMQMATEAGATLVLSDPVLEEVAGHLRATDNEFQHFFEEAGDLPTAITRHADKILIRAYYYARNDPERHEGFPKSWPSYINQFCDYGVLHKPEGKTQIRRYLSSQFNLAYQDRDELLDLVDEKQVAALSERFRPLKSTENLADNDALMTLAVYGRRKVLGESGRGTEFGFRTWWLTGEAAIVGPAQEVMKRNDGEPFMMRPEFLLNFIALAPSTAQVHETYRNVFPSLQGIRLASRMGSKPFQDLMRLVDEAHDLEPGRREAEMASLADKLKSDLRKQYERNL